MKRGSVPASTPVVFEPAFVAGLTDIFEHKIVFNTVLGLKVTAITPEQVSGRIEMRPELIGHYAHNRIHGGVISAALDALGGLAVMAAIGGQTHGRNHRPNAWSASPSWAPSICASITCARASASASTCRPRCLRVGSRVGTSRMEFRGPDGTLMSAGAAAYIVS